MKKRTFPRRAHRVLLALAAAIATLAASMAGAQSALAADAPPAANRLGAFTDYEWSDNYTLRDFHTAGGFSSAVSADGWRVVGIADNGDYQDQLTANATQYSGSNTPGESLWITLLQARWNTLIGNVSAGEQFTVYVEHIPGGAKGAVDPGAAVAISSTEPYYSQTFLRTATGIEVVNENEPPEEWIDTTTTLTAGTVTSSSVELTAAVTPTDAAGTVEFFNGSSSLGKKDVESGAASLKVEGLAAKTPYTFKAVFTPSDAAKYKGSEKELAVTTAEEGGEPAPGEPDTTGQTDITVEIPGTPGPSVGELKLTVPSTPTTLAKAEAKDNKFQSSGELAGITVTDDREDSKGWDLQGRATKFSAAQGSFSSSYLGWTPKLAAGNADVTLGGTVNPGDGATDGLAGTKSLATASKKTGATVGATLNLAAPNTVKAGTYTSTLTIDLIGK